jgi:hypothetical protein
MACAAGSCADVAPNCADLAAQGYCGVQWAMSGKGVAAHWCRSTCRTCGSEGEPQAGPASSAAALLLHCRCTAAALLLHCRCTAAALLLHCCCTAAALLLHCCCTAAALLLHCRCTAAALAISLEACFRLTAAPAGLCRRLRRLQRQVPAVVQPQVLRPPVGARWGVHLWQVVQGHV